MLTRIFHHRPPHSDRFLRLSDYNPQSPPARIEIKKMTPRGGGARTLCRASRRVRRPSRRVRGRVATVSKHDYIETK